MERLLWLAAPLLTMVGVIVLVMAVFRARRERAATPIVRIALIVSAAWAAIALFWGIMRSFLWFQTGIGVPFDLRTEEYWPGPTSDVAQVLGGFSTAHLTAIDTLSTGTRSLLAVGDLISTLVTVALAGLVALACFRFVQGVPFARELPRLSLIAAVIALVGGVASQIVEQFGATYALSEIIAAGLGSRALHAASPFTIDWWPLWLAIGLGAFAALMTYGTALQRDTEGLV
jgi:hypothetical protein